MIEPGCIPTIADGWALVGGDLANFGDDPFTSGGGGGIPGLCGCPALWGSIPWA